MNIFLSATAIALFIFGFILFFKPDIEKRISDWLNKNLLFIEDRMRASNKISGSLLIVLGVVVYYLSIKN